MHRKPVIIAYDIVADKRRRQIYRCLRTWKLDAQYSVFECRLSDGEARELFLQLTDLMDTDEDRLLFSWLDTKREARALTGNASIGFKIPVLYAA